MNALRTAVLTFAATAALAIGVFAPATAQMSGRPYHGPTYNSWQPGWDQGNYDRDHLMIGTVVKFTPFRLQLAQQNGDITTIDLKNGTIIRPVGATPNQNQRVAVQGYFSNGTFIANRIIIRG